MAVGEARVFPSFLTQYEHNVSFQSHLQLFSHASAEVTCEKYAIKKDRLNLRSNSKPPGHESDTFITEPPGQGDIFLKIPRNDGNNRSVNSLLKLAI